MEPGATELLRADHRQVETHLDTLRDALKHLAPNRVPDIRQSFQNIERLVAVHMTKEENVFYPAVRSLADDFLPRNLKQYEEIRETQRYWGELLANFPGSPAARELTGLYRLGIEFHDAVQVHIVEEEDLLLKRVQELLSPHQQQRLLTEMQQ